MRLYVVLLESGKIYGIYSNKKKAQKELADLQDIYYENASLEEHKIM